MAVVHRSYGGSREPKHFYPAEKRISPLIILQVLPGQPTVSGSFSLQHRSPGASRSKDFFSSRQLLEANMEKTLENFILKARFQQKQLQEKEEKLLRLYEEHQERALKSVGSRSHSGGSSISSSSSVGAGKVRHMFQSRRENSEPRLGAAITGRDKSHPLEPLTKHSSALHLDNDRRHRFSTSRTLANWGPIQHQRSLSLDRENNENNYDLGAGENFNQRKIGVRRTQSQVRSLKEESPWRGDLENRGSFQLVDDRYDPGYRRLENNNEDSFLKNLYAERQSTGRSEQNTRVRNKLEKLVSGEASASQTSRMEGRYKSYVSQTTFNKRAHLGNGSLAGRQTTEAKETSSSGYLNGSVSSPVRKIRKPTPVPLSVAPPQHFLQKEIRKTTRIETIREVPTSTPKTLISKTQSLTGPAQKPPTLGRALTSTRASPTKSTPPASVTKSTPSSDLVNCRICGRHFAADRVSKHEEVCQKSLRNKRKPFDALQQRVKGTEVEQFITKSIKPSRPQPEKVAKPQSNWRKKHEEFINNIRAAKEVSAHLKKGGKLSDLPPPPPSDYSDYVPCPHCGRKFNSSAAERHIPKCANIINNKPKAHLQKMGGLKQSSKILHSASSVRGRK